MSCIIDLTGEDVAELGDADLRALVGRLAEATVRRCGHSSSAVTWGGAQDAADGGIDVRFELPGWSGDGSYLPRAASGFQVKVPDLEPNDILREMKPHGDLRNSIADLARRGGAYVIITAASLSDEMLGRRRQAMRKALENCASGSALATDIYDAARLASWAREYPGLAAWARERAGRPMQGWHGYGSWPDTHGTGFIADGAATVREMGVARGSDERASLPAIEGLEAVRTAVLKIGSVRLVGLSGVGKTRFAEALFEESVGQGSLEGQLSLYADLSHHPQPPPVAMATQLVHEQTPAFLVVDNCPPELHRDLTKVAARSQVKVVTIEYDIRDDLPEGTDVFQLEAPAPEFVERLVRQRVNHVSAVDAGTIGIFSGGNARVGLALAHTVRKGDSLGGLSDQHLFDRLFEQRHGSDKGLLASAQALAFVYSFAWEADASDLRDPESHAPDLAQLAGRSRRELHGHVRELQDRGLLQRRGRWRAVLPHAIANRLAAQGLRLIPLEMIEGVLGAEPNKHLFRSFCHRLGFLHDTPEAVGLVRRWLSDGGLLGPSAVGPGNLKAVLSVAPADPSSALDWVERAVGGDRRSELVEGESRQQLLEFIRKLAYDTDLYPRAVKALASLLSAPSDERESATEQRILSSLFSPFLSGTRAPLEMRLQSARGLLESANIVQQGMGVKALKSALHSSHFTSDKDFVFGARRRDYGYHPESADEIAHWYRSFLELLVVSAKSQPSAAPGLRAVFAREFPELWRRTNLQPELEAAIQDLADGRFWVEGWTAVGRTRWMIAHESAGARDDRLDSLWLRLGPTTLADRIDTYVLHAKTWAWDTQDDHTAAMTQAHLVATELGRVVGASEGLLASLIPRTAAGDGFEVLLFFHGVGSTCTAPAEIWNDLIAEPAVAGGGRAMALRGFLQGWTQRDREAVHSALDSALEDPGLGPLFPVLQMAVEVDERGADRMARAAKLGLAPPGAFVDLHATASSYLAKDLVRILRPLLGRDGGAEMAAGVLSSRYHRPVMEDAERHVLAEFGVELLKSIRIFKDPQRSDYQMGVIARECLQGPFMQEHAISVCDALLREAGERPLSIYGRSYLLAALLETQPEPTLDVFLGNEGVPPRLAVRTMIQDAIARGRPNEPAAKLSPDSLLAWCAKNPGSNHAAAMGIVPIEAEETSGLPFSEICVRLLRESASPRSAIEALGARLRSDSGLLGSRAVRIQGAAERLNRLKAELPAHSEPIERERILLLEAVEEARRMEQRLTSSRDERFE